MPEKCEIIKFKNYSRKNFSLFMTLADFGSILIPKNNGKQNPDESYTNKHQNHIGCSFAYKLEHQNHIGCSFGYKLVDVDD